MSATSDELQAHPVHEQTGVADYITCLVEPRRIKLNIQTELQKKTLLLINPWKCRMFYQQFRDCAVNSVAGDISHYFVVENYCDFKSKGTRISL